jgi:hypothetical protein
MKNKQKKGNKMEEMVVFRLFVYAVLILFSMISIYALLTVIEWFLK